MNFSTWFKNDAFASILGMVILVLNTYCICLYSLLSIILPVLANKLVQFTNEISRGSFPAREHHHILASACFSSH